MAVEIMVRLHGAGGIAGCDEYQRPYNDPEKGSVTNVGTWNSSHTAIRGADPTGPNRGWFDLSPSQVKACEEIAEDLGTTKIVVIRTVGSYRTSYVAQTYKFGAHHRYYVVECEIGE